MDRKKAYEFVDMAGLVATEYYAAAYCLDKRQGIYTLSALILMLVFSSISICMVIKWKLGWRRTQAITEVVLFILSLVCIWYLYIWKGN